MKYRLLPMLFLALMFLVVREPKAEEPQSTLDVVKARGTLLAGLRNDYPPAGYVDEQGNWVGFDLDVAQLIADKLGVKLERVQVASKTRVPLLVNGNVDLVIATFGPTSERAEVVDFAGPYFIGSMKILTTKETGIQTTDDLAAPKRTGMVQGSADGPRLMSYQPDANLVYFQEWPQAVLALKQGQVDAVYTTDVTLATFAKKDPDLVIVGRNESPDPYMIGVRQNDSKWRLFLETTIMEAWSDGTLEKIYLNYLPEVTFTLQTWPEYGKDK